MKSPRLRTSDPSNQNFEPISPTHHSISDSEAMDLDDDVTKQTNILYVNQNEKLPSSFSNLQAQLVNQKTSLT